MVTLLGAGTAAALDQSGPAINGPAANALLGEGTGVIVGILDNGININHPALTGFDANGQSRLVAQADFAFDNWNSTSDSTGHGTAVAGIALSSDSVFRGLAPDARYVNARVSDLNLSSNTSTVINGMDFAYANFADIINLSLNDPAGSLNNGQSKLSLAADYFVHQLNVPVVVSAGNFGFNAFPGPTSPADAYNTIAVAASQLDHGTYRESWSQSAFGPTADGRSKPDITAPGTSIDTLARFATGGSSHFTSQTGTSFASPHITGLLASQIGYGQDTGLSTDARVLKATLLNAADKIPGASRSFWQPGRGASIPQDVNGVFTVTSPLDPYTGAGQANGEQLFEQYHAGEQGPGFIRAIGWDLAQVGQGETLDYELGQLTSPTQLTVTLNWNHQVGRFDNVGGGGIIDANDLFLETQALSNLELDIYRDGELFAQSISAVDNVEHLFLDLAAPGDYALRVRRDAGTPGAALESFALAWALRVDGVVPFIAGDLNGDGVTDLLDTDPFVLAIIDPDEFDATFSHNALAAGDFTLDGLITIDDVSSFAAALQLTPEQTQTLLNQIPEPSTMAVLLLGAACLGRRRTGQRLAGGYSA